MNNNKKSMRPYKWWTAKISQARYWFISKEWYNKKHILPIGIMLTMSVFNYWLLSTFFSDPTPQNSEIVDHIFGELRKDTLFITDVSDQKKIEAIKTKHTTSASVFPQMHQKKLIVTGKKTSNWGTRKDFIYTSATGINYELRLPSNKRCPKKQSFEFLIQNLELIALEKERTNVPISLKIFQAWWESNFGQTRLGKSGNYYGIKSGNIAKKYAKGKTYLVDDFAKPSAFWKFDKEGSIRAHSDVVNAIKGHGVNPKNPYIGDWTYKVYLWELQGDAYVCNVCTGYGCKKCGGDGIIGKTYATGKPVGGKANPNSYLLTGLKLIPEYNWEVIDRIYQKEGMTGIHNLINWMKTKEYLMG